MKLKHFLAASVAAAALSLTLPNMEAALKPLSNSAAQPAPSLDEDIRDIRPPYHITPRWSWLAWTAGAFVLAPFVYGWWNWRNRRFERVKLPYELALEHLEGARRLMQPELARPFSIAVSEVVRNYVEGCFGVRAMHRTTAEFLHDLALRPDSPLIAHQTALAEFLQHCDLAKFARWVLSVPQMEAMLQSAKAFILETGKPVERTESSSSPSIIAPGVENHSITGKAAPAQA